MSTTADCAINAPISLYSEKRRQSSFFIQPNELNPLNEKRDLLKKFLRFGENWDGYGAKAPTD